jgi:copper chaperone CopZ
MTTVTVAVEGMTCPTCETSIEGALRRIPEVHSVRADHVSGRVEVTLDRPIEESAVRAAIEEAGYDVARTGASSAEA